MRDKLIHHYFGVKPEIVWGTATEDVPLLMSGLKAMLLSQESDGES